MLFRSWDIAIAGVVAATALAVMIHAAETIERHQEHFQQTRLATPISVSYGERHFRLLQRSGEDRFRCVGNIRIASQHDSVTVVVVDGQLALSAVPADASLASSTPLRFSASLGFNPLSQLSRASFSLKQNSSELGSLTVEGTKTLSLSIISKSFLQKPVTFQLAGPILKREVSSEQFEILLPLPAALSTTLAPTALGQQIASIQDVLQVTTEETNRENALCSNLEPFDLSQAQALLGSILAASRRVS